VTRGIRKSGKNEVGPKNRRVQKERVTGKVYSKVVIWIGQWKV